MSAPSNAAANVLSWPGRLLSEDDLRRHWTRQVEVVLGPKTIVTPLAWDWLRQRQIHVRRGEATKNGSVATVAGWAYAEESPSSLVAAAVKALSQEGRLLTSVGRSNSSAWLTELASAVASGNPAGLLLFCREPGLAVCIANKVSGVRAASISLASQVASLQKALGPNLYAATVEGRTFFEIRQLLAKATSAAPVCPAELAATLKGLDGHAHR